MTALTWDQVGDRRYETGVDKGVLYLADPSGQYTEGEAWNGLTAVNEAPSGAAATVAPPRPVSRLRVRPPRHAHPLPRVRQGFS